MATGKLRIKGVNTSRSTQPPTSPEFNVVANFGSRETSRDLNKDGILVPWNWSIKIDQITGFDVNTFTYSLGTNIVDFVDTTEVTEYNIDSSKFVLNEHYKFDAALQGNPLNFKSFVEGKRIDGLVFKYNGITTNKGVDCLQFTWFIYGVDEEMWLEQGTITTDNTSAFTTF